MKGIHYVFALLLIAALGFTSCNKNTKDLEAQVAKLEQMLTTAQAELTTLRTEHNPPTTTQLDIKTLENDILKLSAELATLRQDYENSGSTPSTLTDITELKNAITGILQRLSELEALEKQAEKVNPPTSGTHADHEWVDLGLSVKWATCNIGAKDNKPEDYGYYYAWGELKGCDRGYEYGQNPTGDKTIFVWDHYLDTSDGGASFNKYNKRGMELEELDDVARHEWGGTWRIPTKAQIDDLRTECYWKWTTTYYGNTAGYIVYKAKAAPDKGKRSDPVALYSITDDAHIFLPAAGYRFDILLDIAGSSGVYWSRSLSPGDAGDAYYLNFDSSSVGTGYYNRFNGLPVRAVCLPATE